MIKIKIAVTGANGQLGSDIVRVFKEKHTVIPLTRKEIDITVEEEVNKLIEYTPDVIIHTAAYTDVDGCERNPNKAFKVNTIGTYNLIRASLQFNPIFVYISTDYVFDGNKKRKYSEVDIPNPINIYGLSKYNGEILVRNHLKKYYIIRVSYLFGIKGATNKEVSNFVDYVIENLKHNKKMKMVSDNLISPTYTKDVAKALLQMLEKKLPFGIYHITNNKNAMSTYKFAQEITKVYDPSKTYLITPIKYVEYKPFAKRPKYSALSISKIKKYDIEIRTLFDALKEYILEKHKNKPYSTQ